MDDLFQVLGIGGIIGLMMYGAGRATGSKPGDVLKIIKFPGWVDWGQGTPGNTGDEQPAGGSGLDNGIDVMNLPANRKLTVDEVYALAAHLRDKHFSGLNAKLITAMAHTESSFRPWVTRSESGGRKSVGLMQTLIGTAEWMADIGYGVGRAPTESELKKPYTSMYFGMAYMDWLRSSYPGHDDEWYVRAYNGGAGWENTSRGPSMTQNHWNKVRDYYNNYLAIEINTGG